MNKNKGSKALGVDRDIYDADLYDGLNDFKHDIPYYLELARKARGPVLELCCGSGRITLPLLEAGIDVTGVDFTPSMLAAARRKAGERGLRGSFLRGDMRKLRLGKKFRLVFIPFNSIQNTYGLEDVEKVFRTVRAHLAPGGTFAFDIFNPSIEYMVRMSKLHKRAYKFTTPAGRKVEIDEICRYDSAAQVNRAVWIHRVDGGRPVEQRLDMRCFYPLEMDALLKYNGFKVLSKYGGYDKKPFTSASMKQLYVCGERRAGQAR
ncbi:MAG: class I SAM-dependent methyltransferase [Actinobacteria bacterium HGW-Actinobacteria-6]|nr:MAG: class I SAM-dependent methyltransferase [Actinobacteria bacterium HGW-Actinobacteria-6]